MGGLGLKQIGLWNIAAFGRQVWAVEQKKDILWVKWISSIYLKGEDFMSVQPKASDSWHWKQLIKVRNLLREGLTDVRWCGFRNGVYSVAQAYEWLLGEQAQFRYAKVLWHKFIFPKHAFILWLVLRRRLLTLDRIKS